MIALVSTFTKEPAAQEQQPVRQEFFDRAGPLSRVDAVNPAVPSALLSCEGAVICWGDEKIHWNFQAFILCKATTRTTKKYDPSLDSLCKDTSLKAIDF